MPVDDVATGDSTDVVVDDGPPPTLIHQFALGEGTAATYVASGEVPGQLLNQFAMSEYDGDLRVATTTEGWNFGDQSESAVYVLRPNGEDLETIAIGRRARHDRADPRGPVPRRHRLRRDVPPDRSAVRDRPGGPGDPVLDGELKIPGYSAYLHPVGDGLLLGVGQDATDDGRILGTQL